MKHTGSHGSVEQTSRQNFMSFCNFRRRGGNFTGQINSIKLRINRRINATTLSGRFLAAVVRRKQQREQFVHTPPVSASTSALASGRFFGYDSRVA
ncbi:MULTISPECIES: hypothetical protein [Paraburkholderia]|uniref:hypothetical protein n=1 Tax=Paraburkholderia TaxID=1822464 RepID=UPI0022541604|nr:MULTISPECIES: hypothetical protein [Paraburkholderia]MCX4160279.1 hypothetical protein [Paraburkholderia megapolitana]MDN7155778.1 hypothetical protein [Paraburkholderia sp. CHISQ3]MDQ6492822.1 hypothetical protein [Paraburkholderia megapolitana]